MSLTKKHKSFFSFVDAGVKLVKASDADALLVLMEKQTDWARLKRKSVNQVLIIATHDDAIHAAATEAEIHSIHPAAAADNRYGRFYLISCKKDMI